MRRPTRPPLSLQISPGGQADQQARGDGEQAGRQQALRMRVETTGSSFRQERPRGHGQGEHEGKRTQGPGCDIEKNRDCTARSPVQPDRHQPRRQSEDADLQDARTDHVPYSAPWSWPALGVTHHLLELDRVEAAPAGPPTDDPAVEERGDIEPAQALSLLDIDVPDHHTEWTAPGALLLPYTAANEGDGHGHPPPRPAPRRDDGGHHRPPGRSLGPDSIEGAQRPVRGCVDDPAPRRRGTA